MKRQLEITIKLPVADGTVFLRWHQLELQKELKNILTKVDPKWFKSEVKARVILE